MGSRRTGIDKVCIDQDSAGSQSRRYGIDKVCIDQDSNVAVGSPRSGSDTVCVDQDTIADVIFLRQDHCNLFGRYPNPLPSNSCDRGVF